jgi:glutamate-ammonia-ligase adenylyltransferase
MVIAHAAAGSIAGADRMGKGSEGSSIRCPMANHNRNMACVNGQLVTTESLFASGRTMKDTQTGPQTTDLPAALSSEATALWAGFRDAAASRAIAVPRDDGAKAAIQTSLALSRFVAQTALRHPDILADLMTTGDLFRSGSTGDRYDRFRTLAGNRPAASSVPDTAPAVEGLSKADFDRLLRGFRHREMVRIAIRDLSGLADLGITLRDLSDLADLCLRKAHDYLDNTLCNQWGTPVDASGSRQRLVILGMGKLGAHELNFSSDIDLIFSYPEDGETQGGAKVITNEEFFVRLCRNLIQTIGATTAEGFVFRVDTRLRPFGESGPLVLSFQRMEGYYETHGREWERYALIKARAVAGDVSSGQRLLKSLKPFVYRRYLDYNAFESLRDMKQRISVEVQSKRLQDNIKLGPGGIREIEFFGQMFQLIRGGVEPALQTRPILEVIDQLVANQYIPPPTGDDLKEAYIFLRMAENRIQAYADRQSHRLPQAPDEQFKLAAAMNFNSWAAFCESLDRRRKKIHSHFNALLAGSETKEDRSKATEDAIGKLSAIWQNVLEPSQCLTILEAAGFSDPAKALKMIDELRSDAVLRPMSALGRDRLAKIMPLLLTASGVTERPQQVLQRLFDLIRSICRRTAYLSLLYEYPATMRHLVRLFESSPWITSLLCRHPVLLDEMLDSRSLYQPPGRGSLTKELRTRLAAIPEDDVEQQLETLRVFKQTNLLRVAASDITSVLPLMKVSDHLSDIAEVILSEVVDMSWHYLAAKHGTPVCSLGGKACDRGFAVIAYGKLGGLELGYGSDLDLVFLHAAAPGDTRGGKRPIDNAMFYTRLGQRVLHILTTHTPAGILYETDMRLRPSGDSGMLVSHIEGFRSYQLEDAWTWEHQALIRARAVTGDAAVQDKFGQIRKEVLCRRREENQLRKEVAAMRQRLRTAQLPAEKSGFDIKQDPGGIVDIEFIVQYLILKHAHSSPEITHWTDNVRQLQELSRHGVLKQRRAFMLRRSYLILRAMSHRLNLRGLPALVESRRFEDLRRLVQQYWRQHMT